RTGRGNRRDALGVIGVSVLGSGFRAGGSRPSVQSAERDTLRVGLRGAGGRYDVSTWPVEAYVARVIAGEAARDSLPAALEALAIAIRTFAMANRARHRADGFDLCDQTHCQVIRAATAAGERAAMATAGQLLLRDGAPAPRRASSSRRRAAAAPRSRPRSGPAPKTPPFFPRA